MLQKGDSTSEVQDAGGRYKPLTMEDMHKLHETAMRTFEEVGVEVKDDEARALFKKAGAEVDEENRVIRMSRDLVMGLIEQAPSTVRLCGRDESGQKDILLDGKNVYLGTGGTALYVQDPGQDDIRQAGLKDIQKMAHCVDHLENIHFYMLNVYPHEIPDDSIDVNRFGAALNRTTKHVMGGVYSREGIKQVAKMAHAIAGSPEEFAKRPFVSMVTCVISPFKLDEHYSRLTMEAVREGIPVVLPAEPLCGATAPITLAGNLVVLLVDTLAGIMLTQLVKPGAPALFGCVASITDLRDMKYLSGAVEMGLLNAGAAQLANFYNLPVYSTAGMSDAKLCDAQAGYESAITGLLTAMAGGTLIHDAAGFLEFCMTASYEKLVIDNEILGMIMRAVQGIEVDESTLAFDQIKKAGPGGQFVTSRHTRRHMRQEQFYPRISDRENRSTWKQQGSTTARDRAAALAETLLNTPTQPVLSEDIRTQLCREIRGLDPSVMDQ